MTKRNANNGRDRRSVLAGSAVMIAVVLLAFALSGITGPASRCEGAGGQMLVGPGGETACFDGRTFLPIEGFEETGNSNRSAR